MTLSFSGPSKPKRLSILCMGDSLTEGYSQMGQMFTPYSTTLLTRLQSRWPEDVQIEVVMEGRSGDYLTVDFEERLESRFSDTETQPFTHVLLLGGTNDLTTSIPVAKINKTIEEFVGYCLSNKAEVILFTIPECHAKWSRLNAKRNEVNKFIADLEQKDGVYIFDLRAKMPFHAMNISDRQKFWDDGLHFTEAGYQAIGEAVAEELIAIIEKDEGSGAMQD